jgi:hypothetical protein
MAAFLDRVASAPISWGICEVPGWGAMLPTPRVLSEMAAFGFTATELGAPGFLPTDPTEVKDELAGYGMTLLGGFTPVVLHDPAFRDVTIAQATATAELFERAGATKFVTAVVVDPDWSVPAPLSTDEQRHMIEMFGVIDEICREHGLEQVLHSHVQTLVETKDDVNRVLDGCDVHWCLDTGHLAIGGVDPVAFAKEASDSTWSVRCWLAKRPSWRLPRPGCSRRLVKGMWTSPVSCRRWRVRATKAGTSSSRTRHSQMDSRPSAKAPCTRCAHRCSTSLMSLPCLWSSSRA